MPQTPLKGMEIQAFNSNVDTWGTGADGLNVKVIGYLDNMMAGVTQLTLSNSNVALTAAQARNAKILLGGTISANIQIAPDVGVLWYGFYYIDNETSGSFTVTVTNGVSGVTIPQGRRCIVFSDQTFGVSIFAIVPLVGPEVIPTGTQMLFRQTSPPTGWTKNVSFNESGLRVVSGSISSGGSVNFSTLFARTSVDNTALNSNQVPPLSALLVAAGAATQVAENYDGVGLDHTHAIDMRLKFVDVIIAQKD